MTGSFNKYNGKYLAGYLTINSGILSAFKQYINNKGLNHNGPQIYSGFLSGLGKEIKEDTHEELRNFVYRHS